MTQGDPLAMVAYIIRVIPLIKCLKATYPDVNQPWYAYYAGALGTCDDIGLYFNSLKRLGPGCWYYPEPSKIVLILHSDNFTSGKEFGLSSGFKVCTGTHYLVSFSGGGKYKRDWLKYRTLKWEKYFCAITKMAGKYPKESYAAVVCAVQSEWIFFQSTPKDTGHVFAGVEKLLHKTFVPCIFFWKPKSLPPIVGTLSTILVKKSGLGLQYLVTPDNKKYLSLLRANSKLIGSVTGASKISTANHLLELREEWHDGITLWDDAHGAKLKGLVKDLEALDRRLILSTKSTGSWMTIRGTIITGTLIAATEFCDFLCIRYDVTPP